MFNHPPHILQIHEREVHERMHGRGAGDAPARGPLRLPRFIRFGRLRELLRRPRPARRDALAPR